MPRPGQLLLCVWISGGAAFAAGVPEPETFRLDDYRSPVPDTLEGVTPVGAVEAHALWMSGDVAFIDVLPRAPKPENLPEGTIWHDQPRISIPGATWLPNVGYGELAEVNEAYFRDNLALATSDDLDHPVLFYCLDECWMSWNAARRAREYGYSDIYWFPEGTDGWRFEGYPTEELQPVPGGR